MTSLMITKHLNLLYSFIKNLYRKNMLFEPTTYTSYMFGPVNYESCKKIIQDIDAANKDEKYKEILLIICSGGGRLYPAFAVYEHIRLSLKPVICLAESECGSAAVPILQAGKERLCTKNTRFKLHSSTHSSENLPYEELERFTVNSHMSYNHFVDLTIKRSGATKAQFEKECIPVKYLTAEDALKFGKHGLIDRII